MLWRGVGAVAAIVVLGAVVGHVATGDDDPPATRSIQVGAATLTVAPGWHVIDGPATTLAHGRDRMRVVLGAPEDPSLVPPALRGETPTHAPKPAGLGGYRAWSYGGVTVLPSTRGVLGVACATPACARAVRSVSITGAAILTPTPDLALRLRAPALLASFDAARVSARAALADPASRAAAAGTGAREGAVAAPARRAAAASASGASSPAAPVRQLADAHRAALDGLRPVAGPALLGALARAAQAYDRLADASSDDARGAVVTADRAVDLAVADLARTGAPAVQRTPAPVATPTGGVPALVLLLVLAAGLLISALAPAGLRRLRASTPGMPCSVAKPCLMPQHRRTPIAPPPTYGRWNEAPRGPFADDSVKVSVLE